MVKQDSGVSPEGKKPESAEELAKRLFTEKLGAALNPEQKEKLLNILGLVAEENKKITKKRLNKTKLPKLPDSQGDC